MKLTHIAACLALLMGFMFISVPNTASAQGQSYAQDAHYLGAGGTPPSLASFAQNPRGYLRHDAAYQSLKSGFEAALGRSLTDAGFQQLLASDQVRLVPCTGQITTAGITPSGQVNWTVRNCYGGENLIQVQTIGGWVTVASQGCFNLVRPTGPATPSLTVTSNGLLPQRQLVVRQTQGIHVHTAACCDEHGVACEGLNIYLPGYRADFINQ